MTRETRSEYLARISGEDRPPTLLRGALHLLPWVIVLELLYLLIFWSTPSVSPPVTSGYLYFDYSRSSDVSIYLGRWWRVDLSKHGAEWRCQFDLVERPCT